MKRFAMALSVAIGLLLATQGAEAGWGESSYGGYQPWYNLFAKRSRLTEQEERLQRFWHDYYDALRRYYGSLDRMDWVAYYKNHGYQINTGGGGMFGANGMNGGPQRITYAPVVVTPGMAWGMPQSPMAGAPPGPQGPMNPMSQASGFGPNMMQPYPPSPYYPSPYPPQYWPPQYPPMGGMGPPMGGMGMPMMN